MKRTKTTERTLQALKKENRVAWLVERRIPYQNVTIDLFNIIDIIEIRSDVTIGIQACGSDLSGHLDKIMEQHAEKAIAWLNGPRRLLVYAWRQRKQKLKGGGYGTRKLWSPRVYEVFLNDNYELYYHDEVKL